VNCTLASIVSAASAAFARNRSAFADLAGNGASTAFTASLEGK
jgi:hypothetical protein